MKKTSSMSKDGSNLNNSRFGCCFRCSLEFNSDVHFVFEWIYPFYSKFV